VIVTRAVAARPSPTLSPTDPVPRGLLTLCPGANSGNARGNGPSSDLFFCKWEVSATLVDVRGSAYGTGYCGHQARKQGQPRLQSLRVPAAPRVSSAASCNTPRQHVLVQLVLVQHVQHLQHLPGPTRQYRAYLLAARGKPKTKYGDFSVTADLRRADGSTRHAGVGALPACTRLFAHAAICTRK